MTFNCQAGIRTTLPVVERLSRARWASLARSSAKRSAIVTFNFPVRASSNSSARSFRNLAGCKSGNASYLVPLPEGLSFEQAVAILVQGLSARYMVRQSSPSDKAVVVTAAAGGVGSLLVQLAKRAGAKQVIALASTMSKLEFCRSLGADFAFDYTTPDWTNEVKKISNGAGADLIYDSVGGNITKAAVAALAPGGQLLFAAVNRFKLEQSDLEKMILNNQSIKGFALLPLLQPAKLRDDLGELFELARRDNLNVTIAERFPLDRANEAHRALESRSTIGKVVLLPA